MDETESKFRAEFKALIADVQSMAITLTPLEAWCLLSHVQLALRHPGNTGPTRLVARQAGRKIQALFGNYPTLSLVAEQGWQPQYDQPAEKSNHRHPRRKTHD